MKNGLEFLLLVAAAAICLPLSAQTGTNQPPRNQANSSVEQQIRTLEEQSRFASSKNDYNFLNQHATDDYLVIAPDGSFMNKKQAVNAMIAQDVKYKSLDFINSPVVRIFGGNTAIVNGEAIAEVTDFNSPLSGTFRFTRVWVKQNGSWKVALLHATSEQPPNE